MKNIRSEVWKGMKISKKKDERINGLSYTAELSVSSGKKKHKIAYRMSSIGKKLTKAWFKCEAAFFLEKSYREWLTEVTKPVKVTSSQMEYLRTLFKS